MVRALREVFQYASHVKVRQTPAIAGLVKDFQKRTFDQYISGIWRNTSHVGILWSAHGRPLKGPQIECSASWSRASMDGPIVHPDFLIERKVSLGSDITKDANFFDTARSLNIRTRMKRLDSIEPAQKDDARFFFTRPVNLHRLCVSRKRIPLIWFTPANIEAERQKCALSLTGSAGFAVMDEDTTCQSQVSDI